MDARIVRIDKRLNRIGSYWLFMCASIYEKHIRCYRIFDAVRTLRALRSVHSRRRWQTRTHSQRLGHKFSTSRHSNFTPCPVSLICHAFGISLYRSYVVLHHTPSPISALRIFLMDVYVSLSSGSVKRNINLGEHRTGKVQHDAFGERHDLL